MTKIKAIIKRRPVLAYFVLAFAISWGAVLIFAGGVPVREDQLELLGVAMLLGPSVAGGVLISLVSGRSGFRDLRARLLKWRVNARLVRSRAFDCSAIDGGGATCALPVLA